MATILQEFGTKSGIVYAEKITEKKPLTYKHFCIWAELEDFSFAPADKILLQ